MKSVFAEPISAVDKTKVKISELRDRLKEISQTEIQGDKRM